MHFGAPNLSLGLAVEVPLHRRSPLALGEESEERARVSAICYRAPFFCCVRESRGRAQRGVYSTSASAAKVLRPAEAVNSGPTVGLTARYRPSHGRTRTRLVNLCPANGRGARPSRTSPIAGLACEQRRQCDFRTGQRRPAFARPSLDAVPVTVARDQSYFRPGCPIPCGVLDKLQVAPSMVAASGTPSVGSRTPGSGRNSRCPIVCTVEFGRDERELMAIQ